MRKVQSAHAKHINKIRYEAHRLLEPNSLPTPLQIRIKKTKLKSKLKKLKPIENKESSFALSIPIYQTDHN